ncbi:MAG TPA: glycosyltransferase family 39 protein, partial [Oculatellaceae cyanobacterium]
MKEKLTHDLAFNPTNWLQVLIVVVLILGVFFRLANLDLKVYWEDEAFTSLRISGYTEAELIQQVFNGHEIGVADLQKYQHPNPEKGVIDTIKGLAVEEPQHTPLYFLMVRLWVQWFGNSVLITRSLSALLSLLVFPCLYWLCRELFESPLTAWIAMAMMAISPFHVVYAQEA